MLLTKSQTLKRDKQTRPRLICQVLLRTTSNYILIRLYVVEVLGSNETMLDYCCLIKVHILMRCSCFKLCLRCYFNLPAFSNIAISIVVLQYHPRYAILLGYLTEKITSSLTDARQADALSLIDIADSQANSSKFPSQGLMNSSV